MDSVELISALRAPEPTEELRNKTVNARSFSGVIFGELRQSGSPVKV